MKSKVAVIALATALSTPLVLANPSIASGLWGTSLVPPTRTYLEAEMRFRASTIKTEAEVEFGQGTFNGVAKTKLSAEVEMLLVNPTTAPDATSIDATIHLGTATCTFTNDPRVTGPFTIGKQTFYGVQFQGSLSESGTDPVVSKGLDCGGTIPAVALGDTATADITGLPTGTAIPTLSGQFLDE